jgi:hypothetical protein
LDADYRSFFDLIAGHLATAIGNAWASEEDPSSISGSRRAEDSRTDEGWREGGKGLLSGRR